MPINPSIGMVGIAVQESRDKAATKPTYVHGLTGGSPFGISRNVESTPISCGTRAPIDVRVSAVEVSPSVETLAFPDSIGEYLYAALGKEEPSLVKSGVYKHIFTMGDKLPYCTLWSQVGTNNFNRADGCKCSELNISATGNEHLAVTAAFSGINAEVGIASIPGEVEPSCFGGKYTTTDCTFKLDASGPSPKEALVADCSFKIANGTSPLSGLGRVMPRDIADGALSVSVEVTTIPDDATEYKKMVTGSADSTKISGKVVMGSVNAKFMHTDNPEYYLEVNIPHVPFTADYPSVDPEGSEGTIKFSCDKAIATAKGESPITITLVNGVESYNGTKVATAADMHKE